MRRHFRPPRFRAFRLVNFFFCGIWAIAMLTSVLRTEGADVPALLKALQAVGPQGAGHQEGARAWADLSRADADALPGILEGMDRANPLAADWIATAAEAVAERHVQRGGKLPAAALEKFVLQRSHAPHARRLAYEWLVLCDPSTPGRLLPGMLDDPSLELRRDAVARLIDEVSALEASGKEAESRAVCGRALGAARDLDQIRTLAARLRKLGVKVDLPRHFGFLVHWQVIGPFDNTGGKGYDTVYPPETKIDLGAAFPGKSGPVKWVDYTTTHEYGQVSFHEPFGEHKGVTAYAITEFMSARAQPAEFRVTSFNAVKVWLNGRLIDAHHVYHSGSQMDQYVSRAELQAGRNVILVKVCQNEQTQAWTRVWGFQLRVCDAQGTAILSTDRK
jgi:hypothetical protein